MTAVGLKASAFGATGASFTVTSTADAVDASVGNGLCATAAGACTLRAAIQETNALAGTDTIVVPGGTYSITRSGTTDDAGDFDISDSVVIAGAGASSTIIDGGNPSGGGSAQVPGIDRLFEVVVEGATISISDLTLNGGWAAEYGGAILNSSSATIQIAGSTLNGSVAGKTGGAIDNHAGGTVNLSGSTLSNNYAAEGGSAINNNLNGVVTLTNSTVTSNSAADVGLNETLVGAGAISNNAEHDEVGTIVVTDSVITENRSGSGRHGAGISNDGAGIVDVSGTTFTKNRAMGDGGGIYNVNGEVTVTASTFSENAATNGGAIASSGDGLVTVTATSFSKNDAADEGGAAMNGNKGSFAIADATFTENTALNGGGFGNEGSGPVTVDGSSFTKNSAFDAAVLTGGEGGGMHSSSSGEVIVTDSLFTDNHARDGGGLANEGSGQTTITSSRFASNKAEEAGGGILVQAGAVRMVDLDVIGNISDALEEGGGGISYAGDKSALAEDSAALESSRILDNKAKGQGGGVDSRGDGPLVITTTRISGNTAAIGGAIHHVGDAPLAVTRSTLSGNVANDGGGVFTDGDGEATIENTTVSGNRAAQFGGGVLVSSRLHVRSSTIASNLAAQGGGISNGGGAAGDGIVFLASSIVASNLTGGNCAGAITSNGGNVESTNTCQLTQLTDQPGTNPLLGPLASNGGPTQTHALLAGSPAQDRAECTTIDPCPPVDQRGVARPVFASSDAGAYESELAPGGGAPPACAGPTERPVAADFDTWISQSAGNSNFGNDAILDVSQGEHALVHFTLPAAPPGCELVSATLQLFAASATAGRTLEAHRIAASWSEFSTTWNNQPATAGAAASSASGLGVREWDVLDQTLAMYDQGAHGFLIRDQAPGGGGQQSFHGREKGTAPPELLLVFDDPDGPDSVPPGDCPTNPQLIDADRDTWVSQSSPTNNFGNDSTLKVKSQAGSNSRALVRFPLPALPPGCTTVSSAALRFNAGSVKEGRTLEALQLGGAWTETGATWSNQPPAIGPAAAAPVAPGIVEWTVAPQVLNMYASANHGFVIRDAAENGSGDEQSINSREKATDGPPVLVIAFDGSTPETTLDLRPTSPTEETSAAFTFTSDREDATFECSLDGAAFAACSSPLTLSGLPEGTHELEVRATRQVRALDPTPARHAWTVAIPPKTTLSGPASPSGSAGASLSFDADDPEATFECSFDDEPWTGCASPVELTGLADGSHELRVRGTDVLGNVEATPAAHTWTVAVPPQTAIDSGPPSLTNLAFATFAFSAGDNGPADELDFECSLDDAPFAGCSSPVLLEGLPDGLHTFSVRATDAAGNRDESAASRSWTVDTTAPETSIVTGPPTSTNDASASFAFASSEDGSSFACSLDDAAFTACESPALYEGLADGPHAFAVQATDEAGNADPSAAPFEWTVDTTPPETSITSSPPALTRTTSAAFSFTSNEDGATFECSLDGAEFADCANGASYDGLADGEHTFAVVATDAAGNVGASAASHSWTVDTVAPETSITSAPPALTKVASASFSFTSSENGSTFACSLDGAEFAGCASGVSYEGLADGPHTFAVRATDGAGNSDGSAESRSWKIDTTAPEVSIVSGPPTSTNDASASFAFASSEDGSSFACSLDDAAFTACESPALYEGLADGRHAFAVQATDEAGNADPSAATFEWTVDMAPPETSFDSGPALLTNAADATFSFGSSEDESGFECSLDSAVFSDCVSPASYAGLAEGAHTFAVRATDAAGNEDTSAASYAWTVDTTAPETELVSTPAALTSSADTTFSFASSEDGSTFACSLDGAAFASCWSPQDYTGLEDGGHTFAVRATDAAGNSDASDASSAWTVDTIAPDTTLDSYPPALTNVSSAGFSFGATEAGATFSCSLDGAALASCASSISYEMLADGVHTFAVAATDLAGNEDASAATYSWTVDTTAPVTSIDSSPSPATSSTGASFSFTSGEVGSTFACSLDGAAFASCTSPKGYAGLADGVHTFAVRATDPAGNTDASGASFAWTIDTAAPDTAIDTFPPPLTSSTGATFSFRSSEEGSSFACSLDGVPYDPCTSPQAYVGLDDGSHTFAVHAIDAADNVDASPDTYTWTVDATPPETSITSGPAELTRSTDASFDLSSTEQGSTFACSLDGGAFSTCASSVFYAGLGDGAHTFAVRATDAAGNTDQSPAEATWTVDTTAPATSIADSPAARTNATTASFSFAATEQGSGFACALDGDAFSACQSPATYTGLAEGAHSFAVRATDPAGNLGSAASFGWTVDTTAPETSIASAPQALTRSSGATFTFTSSEEGGFVCSLDGAAFSSCTGAASYDGLADGPHTFAVRATDAAGNTDATAASHAWTIDSIAPDTTITASPRPLTSTTGASFSFVSTEDGSTFACALDGAAFAPCASGVSYDGLEDGDYVFSVRATDPAGNTDGTPATAAWTVDTTAPQTAIDSGPPETTTSTSASFQLSASEPDSTFACSLDDSDFAACSSPHEVTGLGLGAHELRVRATDLAGNVDVSPASFGWTVQATDTTPPQTTLTAGPTGPTNDPTPTFEFEADEPATFQCRVDSAAFAACTSPHTTAALSQGAHTFDVRATDGAGLTDASPAGASFTVDTTAPQTTISLAPPATTTSEVATFEFGSSETGSSFACSLDGAAFTPCASPASYAVAAGSHTFQVQATDAAANTDASPASHTWLVKEADTASPETTIDAGPAGPTNDPTPTFAFSSSETGSTFACSLDSAPFATCASPVTTGTLASGAHTFEVRATDAAGNTDPTPAARSFTVDTVAPQTTISLAPPATTTSQLATFEFGASETGSSFACSLDGAAFAACTSPASYTVDVGSHSFQVQATDAAGNTDASPASHSWTVQAGDATPPNTTFTSGPSGLTPDSTPTFAFSSNEPGSTFECSLDGAAFAGCTSPVTTDVLADGAHTFEVRATDAAGNTDASPATRSFTVDTVAPDTSITSGPSGPTNDSTPTFAFTSTQAGSTFQCSVDTASFTTCSSPFTASSLSTGAHTFRVRATDPAGNLDQTPASRSVTVDTIPPNTTLNSGPPSSTPSPTASFTFSSSDTTATFECSLDGAAYTACTTPASYTVPVGSHQFRVRARDAASNVDQTPATRSWTVTADTTAPQTTITSGTSGTTTNPVASFFFTSSETGSTFECSLDGAAFASCTSPASYTVAPGAHTFQVRARDAAGNVDASPASSSWTLETSDTTPPDTTIGTKPSSPTTDPVATFTFASTETGSSFECALDGAGFAGCSSPVSYTVSVGSHTFQVRARDAAGNLDQSPASHAWTVEAPPEGDCTTGGTETLGASADSWVLQSSSTSNYGSDSVLKVDSKSGGNARGLVRFALPPIPSGCQVVDAELRLYAGSYKTGRVIQAFALTASWTESTVTWSNQPAVVGAAATAASGSGYVEWNVTSQLAGTYGANTGFLVRDQTEGNGGVEQAYNSREKDADNPPRLVIRFG